MLKKYDILNEDPLVDDNFGYEYNKIRFPKDMVNFGRAFFNNSESSIILYVNTQQRLVGVEQFTNKSLLNKEVANYISNQKKLNGALSALLYTTSQDVMDASGYLLITSAIQNAVYEDIENKNWYDKNTYEKHRVIQPIENIKDFYKYNRFDKR